MEKYYLEGLESGGFPLTAQYHRGIIGLARKLAVKYGKETMEEDFVQVAFLSACTMEKKYRSDGGASFYTYINKPIKSAIQEAFGNPNRNTTRYKTIQRYIDKHLRDTGLYPNVQQISDGTKLTRFQVLSIYYDKYNETRLTNEHLDIPEEVSNYEDITSGLSPEEKTMLDLVCLEEYSVEDLAVVLKVPVQVAKDRLRDTLDKVKEGL